MTATGKTETAEDTFARRVRATLDGSLERDASLANVLGRLSGDERERLRRAIPMLASLVNLYAAGQWAEFRRMRRAGEILTTTSAKKGCRSLAGALRRAEVALRKRGGLLMPLGLPWKGAPNDLLPSRLLAHLTAARDEAERRAVASRPSRGRPKDCTTRYRLGERGHLAAGIRDVLLKFFNLPAPRSREGLWAALLMVALDAAGEEAPQDLFRLLR